MYGREPAARSKGERTAVGTLSFALAWRDGLAWLPTYRNATPLTPLFLLRLLGLLRGRTALPLCLRPTFFGFGVQRCHLLMNELTRRQRSWGRGFTRGSLRRQFFHPGAQALGSGFLRLIRRSRHDE